MKLLKPLPIAVLILSFANIALADISIVNDIDINLGNGAYIRILAIQNATNFSVYNSSDTPANTLEFWINNSRIRFNSTTNKTLYNITYNNITDTLQFISSGTGLLNVSASVLNASSNYYLKSNGTYITTLSSDSNAILSGNRTLSGSAETLSYGPRNVTFSGQSISQANIVAFESLTISVNIADNDGGTLGSAKVEVQKPSGTKNNYTLTQSGSTWSRAFSDTGGAGTYNITKFYTLDSTGVEYNASGSMTFVVGSLSGGGTGGSGGGGGGGGGGILPGAIQNVSELVNVIPLNIKTLAKDETGNYLLNGLLGFGAFLVVIGSGKSKSNGTFLWGVAILFAAAYSLGYLE